MLLSCHLPILPGKWQNYAHAIKQMELTCLAFPNLDCIYTVQYIIYTYLSYLPCNLISCLDLSIVNRLDPYVQTTEPHLLLVPLQLNIAAVTERLTTRSSQNYGGQSFKQPLKHY